MTEQLNDPALVASADQKKAVAAFNALAHKAKDADDCDTPEYVAAEKLFADKDEIFADTDPTSLQGAIEKLRGIFEVEFDPIDDRLGARHLRAVIAYLEGLGGAV